MSAKIIIEGLYKIFGSHPQQALNLLEKGCGKDEIFARTGQTVGIQDASFEIGDGEIFVVMGLSGSGKSTLVRMLNRLIEPTAGTVRIGDDDITAMSEARLIELRRRDMAMVFQSFALLPNRTVYENACFGLEVAGVADDARRDRTIQALAAVGLEAYADSPPSALSGGMQQRVGLARALATDPSIMLMDEAFSALDPLIRAEMQDQLLELQKEHARTVVFISHDLDEALRIGDRIAIMEEGKIVQVAPPTEILRKPANDYVRAFFRGVDVSQVFTVGQIAERDREAEIAGAETDAATARDRLENAGKRCAVVLDDGARVAGTVTVESLGRAIARDRDATCADAFVDGGAPVSAATVLADVMVPLADSAADLPVVDRDGRYVGVARQAAMLRALHRDDANDGTNDGANDGAPADCTAQAG